MAAVHRLLDPAAGMEVNPGLCALAVMTKAPRAGQVKTRLTPPLTPPEAAALNVCFLRDTAAAIFAAISEGSAAGVAAYTPMGEESAWADILPVQFQLIAQRGGGFDERLIHAVEDLLAVGFTAVCLIDSDSPTVPLHAYQQAVALLTKPGDRLVLGPSDDGGYYLIGMKRLHRRVFEEIDWSTERVAQQTKERAAEIGLAVELLPTCFDVDDRATLRRLCAELLGDKPATAGYPAPHTKAFLTDLMAREGRERIWPRNAANSTLPTVRFPELPK
ncbi:MAG: TIGR04282 family arsenosugar biosynthesis glycosyltransferase [Verrucomicrobiota bacterium]|nr:TIGR04282 family arsenosugar biosynthesis glycosyltransferase [Verrucomicrobiota bacterium]